MKAIKKALPVAIIAAFAGAAHAQVSVYGLVDMSYGKNEFLGGEQKATIHSGGDDGGSQGNSVTRFGIKGSTDIAPGIKGNVRLESNGITSDGVVNGNFFNRQAWIGASGNLGEVRIGRQDSIPFQVMGNFDFNGQSNSTTTAYSGVAVWATGRQSRSIQYSTPEMAGVKIQIGHAARNDDRDDNDKPTNSAAATYTMGGLRLGAAYESKRTKDDDAEDFASIAASYDFGVLKVMAGYMDGPGLYTGTTKSKGNVFGVVVPIAGFDIGAHYSKDSRNDEDEVTEVFVNKEVFKNTYGYAQFAKQSSNDAAKNKDAAYAVGVIYLF